MTKAYLLMDEWTAQMVGLYLNLEAAEGAAFVNDWYYIETVEILG